jgi:hypothetical protein
VLGVPAIPLKSSLWPVPPSSVLACLNTPHFLYSVYYGGQWLSLSILEAHSIPISGEEQLRREKDAPQGGIISRYFYLIFETYTRYQFLFISFTVRCGLLQISDVIRNQLLDRFEPIQKSSKSKKEKLSTCFFWSSWVESPM